MALWGAAILGEKAARGEDGRKYPWGDEFDFKRLNCADYHLQKELKNGGIHLTPVTTTYCG